MTRLHRDSRPQTVSLGCRLVGSPSTPPACRPGSSGKPKTLVLGLGNPILSDDGVGIYAVRAAAACNQDPDVAFAEASVGGLRLLDALTGYDRVILVDAIQIPDSRPGDVHYLHPGDLRASLHSGSTHDLSFSGALALGRKLGMPLPKDDAISIIAVQVDDILTFSEECTPAVEAVIPELVQIIQREISTSPA